MTQTRTKLSFLWLLEHSSVLLFLGIYLLFGLLSTKFLTVSNFVNILIQSSSLAIVAIGMTFVLLTAGIDLSVGSIMFLSAVVSGKMVVAGWPVLLAFLVIVSAGLIFGCVNAFFVTHLRIMPFIVTLATLYVGRGLGLCLSQTRAINLPENLLQIESARVAGVPFPILIFAVVLAAAQLLLTQTTFGRQVYAVGNSQETAKKAGINTTRILASVYILSGFCAAVGGMVSVAQLGAVSPTFGQQREFAAIAAAVLGGTSLFGGRGNVFPGTVLGAVLIQTVENGMVIINADPYVYPMVTSAIIFFVVFMDSVRYIQLQQLRRRKIRRE